MSNNKKSSIEWLDDKLASLNFDYLTGQIDNKEYNERHKAIMEQAKAMHKEEVKNAYISGYLDNGYYEGAEEDASKLWEDTYGFAHNATFGGNNE